jgi:hypothetical protein
MSKAIKKGSVVFAKLANDMEMTGIVEAQHGNSDPYMFTTIKVISTKNFIPKNIERYVLFTNDIVRIIMSKEIVEFT